MKETLIKLMLLSAPLLEKEYIKDCFKAIKSKDEKAIESKIYEIDEILSGRQNA